MTASVSVGTCAGYIFGFKKKKKPPIGTGVVSWDSDVSNAIAVSKEAKGGDERGAIFHHNLFNSSPLAQNILKNEGRKGAHCFDTKGTPFGPSSKGGGRDPDFGGMAKLALVAGSDVLFDIMSNRQPPETI